MSLPMIPEQENNKPGLEGAWELSWPSGGSLRVSAKNPSYWPWLCHALCDLRHMSPLPGLEDPQVQGWAWGLQVPFQLWLTHESQHPGCWRIRARSKWTCQIQPAHKISQVPCTSHLFLPCWVYKYVGQGTSFGRTGETEVMAINTGPRLSGVRWGMPQGQGQPEKPHPRGPTCSSVSWKPKRMAAPGAGTCSRPQG